MTILVSVPVHHSAHTTRPCLRPGLQAACPRPHSLLPACRRHRSTAHRRLSCHRHLDIPTVSATDIVQKRPGHGLDGLTAVYPVSALPSPTTPAFAARSCTLLTTAVPSAVSRRPRPRRLPPAHAPAARALPATGEHPAGMLRRVDRSSVGGMRAVPAAGWSTVNYAYPCPVHRAWHARGSVRCLLEVCCGGERTRCRSLRALTALVSY